jgi:hypothetical protein
VRNYHELGECSRVTKVTGRVIWLTWVAAALETIPWKGTRLEHGVHLDNPIWLKIFKNIMFRELPP